MTALLLLLLLALPAKVQATTTYDELIRQYQSFVPEAPLPLSPGPVSRPIAQSAQAADRAEKVLAAPPTLPAAARFFVPDPAIVQQLRPVAADQQQTIDLLARQYTETDLVYLTLLRNPAIRAARRRTRAEQRRITQTENLDAVLRQYAAFNAGLALPLGPVQGTTPAKGAFPFPGTNAIKGELALLQYQQQQLREEMVRRDTITGIRDALQRHIFSRQTVHIYTTMTELLRHLLEVARQRYEAGSAGFNEVIEVKTRLATIQQQRQTAMEAELTAGADILRFLDLPPAIPLGQAAAPERRDDDAELDTLYTIARSHRQELQVQRLQITRLEKMIELAETMILPPLHLGLSSYDGRQLLTTGATATKPAFAETTAAGMGPLRPQTPWFGTNNAYLERSRQLLAAAREKLDDLLRGTDLQVRATWARLDQARREEKLYGGTITNLSQAALEVVTTGYEAGSLPFSQVIQAYNNWLDALLTHARSAMLRGQAQNALNRVLGTQQ